MAIHDETTAQFGDESEDVYLEQLEENIGGSWRKVKNARAFECDLGYGLCDVRMEHNGESWVGKLSAVNPPVKEETKSCSDIAAAILELRGMVRDHGLLLKERSEDLIETVVGVPSQASSS